MKYNIIIMMIILIGACSCLFIWMEKKPNIDPTLLALINRVDNQGNNVDYFNEVGVHGIEDVSYKMNKKSLVVTYGKCKFTIHEKDIANVQEGLRKLGLTVHQTKDGVIYLRYENEVVKRFE